MGGQHKHLWDEENLIAIIRAAGFEKVVLREFDPSLDKPERNHESIYALAIK
jgi:hypothetical protein